MFLANEGMRILPLIVLLAGVSPTACSAPPEPEAAQPQASARAAKLPGSTPRDEAPAEQAFSVQLHVHGSFSEGIGSIDSHSYEASDVGVDVLWWSDHDFRITSYGHESTFGFEDWNEPMAEIDPEAVRPTRRGRRVKQLLADRGEVEGTATIVGGDVREGEHSLELRTTGANPAFEPYRLAITADRGLLKRPLAAEVSILLSVLPEAVGPDAHARVDVTLSEHPPREGLPFTLYSLRYLLGGEDAEPYREGNTFTVPVPVRPGEWNDLALPVSRDAVRGFPFLHGEDNSLTTIWVGVEARRGAEAVARFDDLRIEQQLSGAPVFERQKRLIDEVARDYPKLRQLQGVEISWNSNHLNEFSVDTRVIDYDSFLAEADAEASMAAEGGESRRDRLTRRAVEAVHARGGLVSYNHMYGAMMPGAAPKFTPEEVLERLLANRVYGADILEVGYRDRGGRSLVDHLWVWDRLAEHGLFPVGTGVSDTHGGPAQRWRTSPNNFVSWIYARSPEKADLIQGMRAGRVFFGDRVLFDGTLDLTTDRGARMGQVVLTDRPRHELAIRIEGLDDGDTVQVIEAGRSTAVYPADGPVFDGRHELALPSARPTAVRVGVHTADGAAKVLSNPIVFVSAAPAEGLPPARVALDVAGVASRHLAGFTVTGASALGDEPTVLEVTGRGEDGTLELACGAPESTPPAVELDGLVGEQSYRAGTLRLSRLRGDGKIKIQGC